MTVVLLGAVLVLVLLNGFFVAAEFALVRARRGKIEHLVEEGGGRGAQVALMQIDEISEYLSACQLGITLASIGIGFLGEPAIAKLIEPAFGGVSHGVAVAIALIIAYAITTTLHITIGEQVPKIYAITRAERVVVRIARPLHFFRISLKPFVFVLEAASSGILRLFGIRAEDMGEGGGSPEELKLLIAESLQGGKLDAGEAGMLSGVFHLHEQEARQVMTPIPAVITVDVSATVEEALRKAIESGHTRLVVIEDDDKDRVRGIVHANALAKALMEHGENASIESLVKDAPIVPETRPLDDLLADLQRQRSSLAVVIDEYGRVQGIVTVEDIIEEIVGEIEDETDPEHGGGDVRQLANGDWLVRGHVPVTDLLDHDIELPATDDYNSVGGLVFTTLGRLPRRGDTVNADGYSIRVESVDENRVESVRIRERGTGGGRSRQNAQ